MELRHVQNIDDRSDARRRIAFEIHGLLLNQHGGGELGKINQYEYKYLTRELVRLVNLGPKARLKRNKEIGFPICPKCGETRSPFASDAELDNFEDVHRKRCKIQNFTWAALHVEVRSDTLLIGPYLEYSDAVNVMESLRIGSRQVLDMAKMDLEGFVATDDSLNSWAVLYDPMPGGSGFLPQICEYWSTIVEAATEALEKKCDCDSACYSCMLHFRNQQYHEHLNRFRSVELLMDLRGELEKEHEIPAVTVSKRPSVKMSDSDAEVDFLKILQARNFPQPPQEHQYIDLGGGSGIEADYVYPDEKILIFIDGMSRRLHGDPKRRNYDRLQRSKAEMQGYKIVETSAEGLKDKTYLAHVLNRLAIFLKREDLVDEAETI